MAELQIMRGLFISLLENILSLLCALVIIAGHKIRALLRTFSMKVFLKIAQTKTSQFPVHLLEQRPILSALQE